MKHTTRFFSFLFFISVACPLLAQQDGNETLYSLQDSVVIVANRYASPLARETNSIVVIEAKTITRLADHSLLEILKWDVPSAYVTQTRVGGFGVGSFGTGAVYLRGMGGRPNTGVAVMIDGHPDFMGIFGHPLPDVYGMDDIERVDVLLGPASTVFGSSALGGVINIVSADVTRNSFRVSAEGGSWGSYNSSVGVTRRLGDHGLQLTLAHGASDGHVPQTDFTSTRVQGGWDWKISQTWRLSFRGRYTPFRFDDPSRTDDRAGFGAWGDIRRGMGQMLLKNESGGLSGSTQLYLNAGHHKFEDGFVSDDRIYGLSSYQQWRAGRRLSVAAGTDLISYGGITNVNDTEYTLNTFGLYALGMFSPLDLLHIRAGLRFQHNDIGLNTFAPSAGLSVTPIAGVRVFANMQSGFRHPTPRELYLFPPANAELQEERSIGYEVGLEYLIAQGSIRAAWFRTDATNLIATVANPAPPPPMRNLNIRDVEINGLEFTARYRLLPFLFAQLSWNKLDAGDYTAYNPSQQLKYMLHLSYRSFGASVAGQYIHELFAGDRGSLPLPDYHLMDVVLTWQSPWKLELYMKARNILDREYYVLPGYVAPGRHFFGGFRYLLH